MMNRNDFKTYVKWLGKESDIWEAPETVSNGFFEIVDGDRDGMCKALEELSLDDLDSISGIFREILVKYPDKIMKKFINKLIKKLEDNGYDYTY